MQYCSWKDVDDYKTNSNYFAFSFGFDSLLLCDKVLDCFFGDTARLCFVWRLDNSIRAWILDPWTKEAVG
jgi:hypothetical protein